MEHINWHRLVPLIAEEHPDAPEGLELYKWVQAAPHATHVTVLRDHGLHPWAAVEEEAVAQATLVKTHDILPKYHDRHAGRRLSFGWDEESRIAAFWLDIDCSCGNC